MGEGVALARASLAICALSTSSVLHLTGLLLLQRHPSASDTALDRLLQLYRQASTPYVGEGVALALAEAAALFAPEDAMCALNFLLSTGFLAHDDAVRGLMLEAGAF